MKGLETEVQYIIIHVKLHIHVVYSVSDPFPFMHVYDAPIIGLVIGINHYRPLFLVSILVISERCTQYCKNYTNNVISCDLIAFMKMLIFIERIRNQKGHRIGIGYWYIFKVITGLLEYQ